MDSYDGYIWGAIVYGIIVSLLTVAHEIWIIVTHHRYLIELEEDSFWAFIDAIPTYLPFLIFFTLLIILIKCTKESDDDDDSHEHRLAMAVVDAIIVMFLGIFFHCIYIIIVMCKGVKAHISNLPSDTICFCYTSNNNTQLGLSLSKVYRCVCRILYEENIFSLSVSDPNNLNKSEGTLQQYGFNPGERITTNIISESQAGKVYSDLENAGSFRLLLLLVQVSLIIYVMRCPIWISLRYYILTERIESLKTGTTMSYWRSRKQVTDETDQPTESDARNADSKWKKIADYAKHRSEHKKKIAALAKQRRENTKFFIELTYYGFTEGLDAFSLLEEFVERGDYFKANHHLTNSVLAFISISFLVVIVADSLSVIPIISDDEDDDSSTNEMFEIVVKLIVVLINNCPFLVIRIYLFWLFGLNERGQIDSVFLLFIVKEVTVIVLGVSEVVSKIRTRNKENLKIEPEVLEEE